MGLLPGTLNCGLRMRRECRVRFPRRRFQRKPLFIDPGMHQGTCVTHVPWCKSGSLSYGGGENVPRIPGACATRNFTNLVRGPLTSSDGFKGNITHQLAKMNPKSLILSEHSWWISFPVNQQMDYCVAASSKSKRQYSGQWFDSDSLPGKWPWRFTVTYQAHSNRIDLK